MLVCAFDTVDGIWEYRQSTWFDLLIAVSAFFHGLSLYH